MEYLNRLINEVNEINEITDMEEKAERIFRFSAYCSFLYRSECISLKDFNYIVSSIKNDPTDILSDNERDNCIKELIDNNNLLESFYTKYIYTYNNNFIPSEKECLYSESIYSLFKEFIKYMNCKGLYFTLLFDDRICFNVNIDKCICINDRNSSYILINKQNDFKKWLSLSHELGHAFENKIMEDKRNYFALSYDSEIISILFQRIFVEFVINSNILSNNEIIDLINEFEINYYRFLTQSYFITGIVNNSNYQIYDYEVYLTLKDFKFIGNLANHNYAIGNLISLNLLNEWHKGDRTFINKLPELIKEIHQTKLNDLINRYDNEEVITQEIKRLVK